MAIYPGAQWHGPVVNEGGQMAGHRLIVMHIMEGTLDGTDGWFQNPSAQVSAHFGVGRDGRVIQWVDTDDTAWAEASENPIGISIEHEGSVDGVDGLPPDLTLAQSIASARILAWCSFIYGIPLARTSDPNGEGIIGHGELGVAGGNHPNCPGQAILDAVPAMINWIIGQDQPPAPAPTPAPTPQPTPAPVPPITMGAVQMPNLVPGQTHPAVQTLRDALNRKGFACPPTGLIYGGHVAKAVVAFKTAHGRSAAPGLNPAVWTLLLDA